MWLQTKFGREMFSVFSSFPFPKVPSMEFPVSVEYQPFCVQSYLFETQVLILSGDNPLKPCPYTGKGQGEFSSVIFQTLYLHSSVLFAKLSWLPRILHWGSPFLLSCPFSLS